MPELPEVETIARNLTLGDDRTPPLPGQRIQRARVGWARHIGRPSAEAFRRKIRGRTILDVGRRGKFLVFPLDAGTMLVHLRMSGDLKMAEPGAGPDPYAHTVFQLDNGWELRFSDARKFGKVYLVDDPQSVLGSLGPEPLSDELTSEVFAALLRGRRRMLKPLLLDQTFLAGLGNIYVDESLHAAGLHPLRRSDTLTEAEARELWKAIRGALRTGIRHNGASLDWVYRGGGFQNHFRVYQRAGEPCPACGTPIVRTVVGQRGTYSCPVCQAEPSP